MKGFFYTSSKTKKKTRGRVSASGDNSPRKKTQFTCSMCGLYKEVRTPRMSVFGNFKKRILNIGEAPGETEDARGKQWQGQMGQLLQDTYKQFGIDLFEDCLNINAINCRPTSVSKDGKVSNRTPSTQEIACCRRRVLNAIEKYEPHIIVLIGGAAVESVIGSKWKKDLGGISKWRGFTIPDRDFNAWVCPVFHPSYISRTQNPREKHNQFETTWLNDLQQVFSLVGVPLPEFPDERKQVVLIEDPKEITSELKMLNHGELPPDNDGLIAFDLETSGLKPQDTTQHGIACMAFCGSPGRAVVFPAPRKRSQKEALQALLVNDRIGKIAANIKFEDTWMSTIYNISVRPWAWDTMLASHVLDNRTGIKSLKFQVYIHFGVSDYDSEIEPFIKGKDSKDANSRNRVLELMDDSEMRKKLMIYCGLDALYTYKLAKIQRLQIEKESMDVRKGTPTRMDAYRLLHDGALALARAERRGIGIDTAYCKSKKEHLTRKITRAEAQIEQTNLFALWKEKYGGSVNINSNPQLGTILYKQMKIKPSKLTASKKGSTDEETLRQLSIEKKIDGLDLILQIRKLKKLRDTYLDAFEREQVDGRIHPFFHLHTVVTYRSSSSQPNFQNVPNRDYEAQQICRKALIPRKGHQLLEVDFSGLEVAIAACYHKDPEMLRYLHDPKSDMHRDSAKDIFFVDKYALHDPVHIRLRKAAKNGFVFPQFYGDYYENNAHSLCEWVSLPTMARKRWKGNEGISFTDGTPMAAHLADNGVYSFDDFVHHLKEIEKHFWYRRFPVYRRWRETWVKRYQRQGSFETFTGFCCRGVMGRNEAFNYPVQGSAFHCLLWTFIQLDMVAEQEVWDSQQIGQIHDADLLDTHPDELGHVATTVNRIATVELPKAWKWIIVPLELEAELCPVDAPWSDKQHYDLPKVK